MIHKLWTYDWEILKRDDHECFARYGFVPDFGPGSFAFFDKVDFISSMKFVDSMPDQKLEENQEDVEFRKYLG